MTKNRLYYVIFLTCIIVLSFFLYSSRFYPLLNSDDALNVLMTYYYDLPEDLYCWGQDRGGTFIPLVSQFFHRVLGFSPVLSVSFSNYLVLILGYLGFTTLFKNRMVSLLFALLWFFPPVRFIDLTRFPIGVQYSLAGMAIFFINRIDFGHKKAVSNHLNLLAVILLLSVAIWVSDLAIVTVAVLSVVLLFHHFVSDNRKRISRFIYIYGALGITGLYFFIRYAKANATGITANYTGFNDWNSMMEALLILGKEFWQVFSFQSEELLFSWFAWLAVAFCFLLVKYYQKENAFRLIKMNRWASFFLADFLVIFGVILISRWVFLNGMGRWYFIASYISLSMFTLLMFDNLKLDGMRKKIISLSLLLAVVAAGLSTVHYLKFVRPEYLHSQIKVRGEFLSLGEIGIIGEYWNSYVSMCPDPSRIKATAHDRSVVRNQELVDEVFARPDIYVIRDMWMTEFPDTLVQFGHVLRRSGEPFRLGDCDVCKYDEVRNNKQED